MVTIRITASLAKKIGIKLLDSDTKSTGKLGDWYATDFRMGRDQFILCTSENGRLPIVLEAAPYKSFPDRLRNDLRVSLATMGLAEAQVSTELESFSECHFAKTNSRSVVGTMVDSVRLLEGANYASYDQYRNRLQMNTFLEGVPHLQLKSHPREMVQKIFDRPVLKVVK